MRHSCSSVVCQVQCREDLDCSLAKLAKASGRKLVIMAETEAQLEVDRLSSSVIANFVQSQSLLEQHEPSIQDFSEICQHRRQHSKILFTTHEGTGDVSQSVAILEKETVKPNLVSAQNCVGLNLSASEEEEAPHKRRKTTGSLKPL